MLEINSTFEVPRVHRPSREQFEERFRYLVKEIEKEIKATPASERQVKAAELVNA